MKRDYVYMKVKEYTKNKHKGELEGKAWGVYVDRER